MANRFFLLAIVLVIVAISGCVNLEETFNIPGFEPEQETISEVNDILKITNIQSIPMSPVLPDTEVELSFRIESIDTKKYIENVGSDIYDACMFDVLSPGFSERIIFPRGVEPVYFKLKTPSVEQIGNIDHVCDVKFYVDYDFHGSTLYDLVVINLEEVKQTQQAGKETPLSVVKAMGSGPIKIDVNLVGVKEAVIAEQTAPIEFVLLNKGSGILKDNEIAPGTMHIYFPANMFTNIDTANTAGNFSCGRYVVVNGKSYMECTNQEEIKMFHDKSSPVIFYITFRKVPLYYQTFTIRATVDYTYQLRGTHTIKVKSFAS